MSDDCGSGTGDVLGHASIERPARQVAENGEHRRQARRRRSHRLHPTRCLAKVPRTSQLRAWASHAPCLRMSSQRGADVATIGGLLDEGRGDGAPRPGLPAATRHRAVRFATRRGPCSKTPTIASNVRVVGLDKLPVTAPQIVVFAHASGPGSALASPDDPMRSATTSPSAISTCVMSSTKTLTDRPAVERYQGGANVIGQLRQRRDPLGHDMHLNVGAGETDPVDLPARCIGRDLTELAARQARDARHAGRSPRRSTPPARPPSWEGPARCSLHSRFGVLTRLAHVHVVDRDVHLSHLETGHLLDLLDDVVPDRLGEIDDGHPVLGDHVEVHGGLSLTDLDADTLRRRHTTPNRKPVPQCADRSRPATAELMHTRDLTGSHPGDLLDHRIGDARLPPIGRQRRTRRSSPHRRGRPSLRDIRRIRRGRSSRRIRHRAFLWEALLDAQVSYRGRRIGAGGQQRRRRSRCLSFPNATQRSSNGASSERSST